MTSLKVEFVTVASEFEIASDPQIHDITVPDGSAVPQVLENPHVDFPGRWVLTGEGEGGTYRYTREDLVADTSDTAVG